MESQKKNNIPLHNNYDDFKIYFYRKTRKYLSQGKINFHGHEIEVWQ